MVRRISLLFFAAVLLLATSLEAHAFKRVALVVGNSAYQNAARLPNPGRDASSIAEMFRNAGFDVVVLQQDVGNLDFKRAVRRFEEAALEADVAVVFYAGHGIEIGGVNYMIPIDAKLASDFDAPDEAIPLDRIIDAVTSAKRLHLVILDACRDNPFVAKMTRRVASRSVSAGLAKVEPATADTLIAYAAKAGSTAADGTGEHSPYTTALLHNLMLPGVDIRLAFGRVRDEVMKITGQSQEPFVYGSLGGTTVSLLDTSDAPATALSAPVDPNAEARLDYEQFEKVGTKEAWDAFLTLHASGPYADLARAQRAKLAASGAQKPDLPTKPDAKASQIVAALTTPTTAPGSDSAASIPPAGPNGRDIGRMLQTELKRVGCYEDVIDGEWSGPSRRALNAFNQNAGTKLEASKATLDAVDAVRDKPNRVCPLTCGRGLRADGDRCVAIACDPGYVVGKSGACEQAKDRSRAVEKSPPAQTPKKQMPEPKREVTGPPAAPAARAAPSAASAPARVACDRFGCQPVKKGCSVRTSIFREETQQEVVCN